MQPFSMAFNAWLVRVTEDLAPSHHNDKKKYGATGLAPELIAPDAGRLPKARLDAIKATETAVRDLKAKLVEVTTCQ